MVEWFAPSQHWFTCLNYFPEERGGGGVIGTHHEIDIQFPLSLSSVVPMGGQGHYGPTGRDLS